MIDYYINCKKCNGRITFFFERFRFRDDFDNLLVCPYCGERTNVNKEAIQKEK